MLQIYCDTPMYTGKLTLPCNFDFVDTFRLTINYADQSLVIHIDKAINVKVLNELAHLLQLLMKDSKQLKAALTIVSNYSIEDAIKEIREISQYQFIDETNDHSDLGKILFNKYFADNTPAALKDFIDYPKLADTYLETADILEGPWGLVAKVS